MNNTALAIIQPQELDTIQRTAKLLAASGYFGTTGDTITGIAQVAAKILAGRELGFGPFASVNGVHIISGKPAVGANLMAAAVRANPRYDYRVKELSDTVCELEFFDNGKVAGVSRFTIEDAKNAELSTGRNAGTWKKYPRNMLFARAMSNGVRWYAPDIFSGNVVYVPEELGVEVDGEGNVVATTHTVSPQNAPERAFDVSTIDNTYVAQIAPQNAVIAVTEEANPFEDSTPYYVRDWHRMTGKPYDFVQWISSLHKKNEEPCTMKQYQYLAGLLDGITGNQHGYVLSVLCQAEIDKTNLPGKSAASALLKLLPETVKDEQGNEVPNKQYRADVVEMLRDMAQQPMAEAA